MTSWSLRPARRASIAPAVWMPSCELPARRMTASRMFCGRRSALPTVGVDAEADSDRTEGVLTKDLWKYRDGGQEVKRGRTQGLKDSRIGRRPSGLLEFLSSWLLEFFLVEPSH